jgi:formamidopyrimidine-DNA glycosylase
VFDNGKKLNFSDGVSARLVTNLQTPVNYQLLLNLTDDSALVLTVGMYGGIALHDGGYENEYYQKSKASISPFSDQFDSHFRSVFAGSKQNLSAKAFLATEQRFPGIGNGVLQDILFSAGIHPKRKIGTLSTNEQNHLLRAVVTVLGEMTELGGRDTEMNIFGEPGGYKTRLSKNTLALPCPKCNGNIVKEPYLGGAVYYCANCQLLESV